MVEIKKGFVIFSLGRSCAKSKIAKGLRLTASSVDQNVRNGEKVVLQSRIEGRPTIRQNNCGEVGFFFFGETNGPTHLKRKGEMIGNLQYVVWYMNVHIANERSILCERTISISNKFFAACDRDKAAQLADNP